jgi:broad specificity phosphatase PhoE
MKILEIRRHSLRTQPVDRLNQAGVALARSVGQQMGPFERVITSHYSRAFETALAMGFAVNEQVDILSTYGEYDVEKEVPWPQTFAVYAQAMKANGDAAKYARKLADFYANIMNEIDEGKAALTVHHGGVVEIGVVACLPHENFESWGGHIDYCEGAKLFWKEGQFVDGEILRVST